MWISLIYVFTPERNISRKTVQTFYKRTFLFMTCCVNDCIFFKFCNIYKLCTKWFEKVRLLLCLHRKCTCSVISFQISLFRYHLTKNKRCKILPHICHKKVIVQIINNYWMRLSMISWIIKTEVCVICRSLRLRHITQTRGFDNSWYHGKTEFNNCFIIHFSHNSSSETEAKRSTVLFLRRTLQAA